MVSFGGGIIDLHVESGISFCFHPGCFDRTNETEYVTRILQSIETV